jgi:hypothetical protein
MKAANKNLSDADAAFLEENTQAILDNMSAIEAFDLSNNPEQIKKLTDALAGAKVNGASALETLNGISQIEGEEVKLTDKVKAYKELQKSLAGMDQSIQNAFALQYQEFEF